MNNELSNVEIARATYKVAHFLGHAWAKSTPLIGVDADEITSEMLELAEAECLEDEICGIYEPSRNHESTSGTIRWNVEARDSVRVEIRISPVTSAKFTINPITGEIDEGITLTAWERGEFNSYRSESREFASRYGDFGTGYKSWVYWILKVYGQEQAGAAFDRHTERRVRGEFAPYTG